MPKLIFVHENKNVSAGWLCEEDGNKLILRLKCKESATFNKNREIFRIDIGQMYSFEELQLLFEQALEIDLEEMWEVANSFQSDLSLHDLVVLIFGAYSAENLIKAAYRFAVDQIYFVIRDSKIIPRSREAVLQKKIELAKRQALESKAHNFVEWLKNANSNNIDLDLINSAIKYALDNESQDSLFDIVKAKLGIKSESLRTLILKNLYARNIITPLTNLPFIASNIQKEGIAIDELSNSIEMFEIEDKSEAVSVDNPETRDIDDAFYFESSEHNYKVAVYISNVAPHITLGT
ncbi:MAG: hypothetical protein NZO16_07730, partial [Deltaproteobacteria bacterium]|nr:hypothetical protein [Deltaproteobacteria bacterium]